MVAWFCRVKSIGKNHIDSSPWLAEGWHPGSHTHYMLPQDLDLCKIVQRYAPCSRLKLEVVFEQITKYLFSLFFESVIFPEHHEETGAATMQDMEWKT